MNLAHSVVDFFAICNFCIQRQFLFLLLTECSVSTYGSSLTGFGLRESDVNLDLFIPDEVLYLRNNHGVQYTPLQVSHDHHSYERNLSNCV